MNPKEKKTLLLFLVLTFIISWGFWIFSGILTREGDFLYDSHWLFAQIGVFAPSLVAMSLKAYESKGYQKNLLKILLLILLIILIGFLIANNKPGNYSDLPMPISIAVIVTALIVIIFFLRYKIFSPFLIKKEMKKNPDVKWIFLSMIFFPTLFLVGWLLANLPEKEFAISKLHNDIVDIIKILVLTFSFNLILGGSMGEEIGWRGFTLPLLLKSFNPIKASLILGLIWAFWHFPIDITSSTTIGPLAVIHRFIWTLPLTLIFTWFYLNTGGSLLIALLLHTSINILPDLGFQNYEMSVMVMTVLLIVAGIIISFKPEMKVKPIEHL